MPSSNDRRQFLKGAGALGIAALGGCISETDDGEEGTQTTTTEGETETSEPTTTAPGTTSDVGVDTEVGMVYATGGLGDKSFNDMAQKGALRAEDRLGISFDESQPETNSDFKPAQRRFAESSDPDYDLISCIGFAQTDALKANADRYPDQHWMLVDSVVEKDNVANYVFKEHEGSFLVGYLAGTMTTQEFSAGKGETDPSSKSVGFVGGVKAPLIQKFEAGFIAGVKHADESVNVTTSYIGSFNDPSAGKEAALSMYDSGADIVYHASGATGLGVFQAAKQTGKFAIGVDADQSRSEADFKNWIMASMVKRVDVAVYTAIEAQAKGEFEGNSINTLGLEKEGVDCVYGQTIGDQLPQSVTDEVASVRDSIIAGDITVPTEP